MNWTCLVYGGPMAAILIWYAVSARHWFKGPKVNIEHQMIGREGNVIDGKEHGEESGGSSSNSFSKEAEEEGQKRVDGLA